MGLPSAFTGAAGRTGGRGAAGLTPVDGGRGAGGLTGPLATGGSGPTDPTFFSSGASFLFNLVAYAANYSASVISLGGAFAFNLVAYAFNYSAKLSVCTGAGGLTGALTGAGAGGRTGPRGRGAGGPLVGAG